MDEALIINELVDHNQYYRVIKQPSPEEIRNAGNPNWALADQDRFSTLKHRQNLMYQELQKKLEEYENARKLLYDEDDMFDWGDYERFSKEKNVKLRDLNRMHIP